MKYLIMLAVLLSASAANAGVVRTSVAVGKHAKGDVTSVAKHSVKDVSSVVKWTAHVVKAVVY